MAEGSEGLSKAARLLVALGPQAAGEVLANMSEEEIAAVAGEMAKVGALSAAEREEILLEFCDAMESSTRGAAGGARFALEALRRAVGEEKATTLVGTESTGDQSSAFAMLRKIDPSQLLNFIQHEHPQTIAVILSNLDPSHAAAILGSLPEDLQAAVTSRMATLEQIAPEMLEEIENVLKTQLASVTQAGGAEAGGGVKAVAEILNRIDRAAGRRIMEQLADEDPEIAERVRRLMFVFDDITKLDDRSIQQVIKEIDTKEIALAFKAASDEVKERIFANLSQRAGDMIREEMEYMGPVRLRDVEAAQQRIIDVILRLEEEGSVVIAGRGGEDQIIV